MKRYTTTSSHPYPLKLSPPLSSSSSYRNSLHHPMLTQIISSLVTYPFYYFLLFFFVSFGIFGILSFSIFSSRFTYPISLQNNGQKRALRIAIPEKVILNNNNNNINNIQNKNLNNNPIKIKQFDESFWDNNTIEFSSLFPYKNQSFSSIIILGMHRSGTSMLTGLLSKMGIYLGPNSLLLGAKIGENDKGFYERADVIWINDKMLEKQAINWALMTYKFDPKLALEAIEKKEINIQYPYSKGKYIDPITDFNTIIKENKEKDFLQNRYVLLYCILLYTVFYCILYSIVYCNFSVYCILLYIVFYCIL